MIRLGWPVVRLSWPVVSLGWPMVRLARGLGAVLARGLGTVVLAQLGEPLVQLDHAGVVWPVLDLHVRPSR
jgi:hypothetical protein